MSALHQFAAMEMDITIGRNGSSAPESPRPRRVGSYPRSYRNFRHSRTAVRDYPQRFSDVRGMSVQHPIAAAEADVMKRPDGAVATCHYTATVGLLDVRQTAGRPPYWPPQRLHLKRKILPMPP